MTQVKTGEKLFKVEVLRDFSATTVTELSRPESKASINFELKVEEDKFTQLVVSQTKLTAQMIANDAILRWQELDRDKKVAPDFLSTLEAEVTEAGLMYVQGDGVDRDILTINYKLPENTIASLSNRVALLWNKARGIPQFALSGYKLVPEDSIIFDSAHIYSGEVEDGDMIPEITKGIRYGHNCGFAGGWRLILTSTIGEVDWDDSTLREEISDELTDGNLTGFITQGKNKGSWKLDLL